MALARIERAADLARSIRFFPEQNRTGDLDAL